MTALTPTALAGNRTLAPQPGLESPTLPQEKAPRCVREAIPCRIASKGIVARSGRICQLEKSGSVFPAAAVKAVLIEAASRMRGESNGR